MKILVCDPVSPKGVELLKRRPEFEVVVLERKHSEEELIPLVKDAACILVRSETKITKKIIESAPKLRIIGRAGVGVDNVDVESATKHGVVVVNTPGGNTISTAELTFAMIMALVRKIPQANASMKAGEWNRKAFQGTELYGKTLGIIGLGRIGSEVAKRAHAFGMIVIGHDPFLSPSRAEALNVELVDLDTIYAKSDIITVHIPMSDTARGMINAAAIAKMKKGVRLINCARGGIINEKDLAEAIKSGHVAGAALDVYETEPPPPDFVLRDLPQVILTPHLGASTAEAQINVGIEVAEVVMDYLLNGTVRNAVNLPSLDAKTYAAVKPYLLLGERLGKIAAVLAPTRNERVVITYGGKASQLPADPITRSVLQGFLASAGAQDVNFVNVNLLAKSIGLKVEEVKSSENTDFTEWLNVSVFNSGKKVSVSGTFFGTKASPRVVRINEYPVEIAAEGVLLILTNRDRPGIVGEVGTLMGKYKVNIANMSLSRDIVGGLALTVLSLDSLPSSELLKEIQSDPDISNVHVVQL